VARKLRAEYAVRVERLKLAHGVQPGIAVILVGDNPASQVYVRNKVTACREVGIHSELHQMPADTPEQALLERIDALNADPAVHGILVQLPLPPQITVTPVLERIAADKDVDGFHLYNVGSLITGNTVFPPCTPYGVTKLLEHENVPIAGQNVVVVGASNIVGKPMALMLMQQDATVCICHKKTRDLGEFTRLADILVVAAGVPGLIKADMVKQGVVVIDVGINRLPDGRIVGDVDFEGVSRKASLISPVPGGVGPMTITMLLHNTIGSAERSVGRAAAGLSDKPRLSGTDPQQ
jgi:methylenetetrahydrofolate dehydrogenase (NADP+)/methenyltetrahydrofolate cyclohydrolase